MDEKYKKIISLPHHVSETRAHMPMIDRAAQFSPFAALTGHDAALNETARLTDTFIEPDEDEKQMLDAKIHIIMDCIGDKPEISIVYFVPDEKKDGGAYMSACGYVKKIDFIKREITMDDGKIIPADCVKEINGAVFDKIILL